MKILIENYNGDTIMSFEINNNKITNMLNCDIADITFDNEIRVQQIDKYYGMIEKT